MPNPRSSAMEGGSPDGTSAGSGTKRSSVSSRGKLRGSSSSGCKDFLRNFVDSEILTANLEDWLSGKEQDSEFGKPAFDVPFEGTELQNLDYALEGISFQQLIRMPNAMYASTSDTIGAAVHLAIEDFLHACLKGLWETFWGLEAQMPFAVSCIHSKSSKFYSAEKAIDSGKLGDLCATAVLLKNDRNLHGRWDHILELALSRPDIGTLSMRSDQRPSDSALGEAFFYALRVLLSRSLSRSTIMCSSNCIYVLLVDSQCGSVVKVEGDVRKLDLDINNVYECAADWIKLHADIAVSPIDQIWNRLGNANWRDIGSLQVLLATFHCMVQLCGMPKHSIEDLATEHGSRLLNRRTERQLIEALANGYGLFRLQQQSVSPEIVEVQEDSARVESEESLMLEKGSVLWLEDSNRQKGFQIDDILIDSEVILYCASPVEEPGKTLLLYVGSSPSHLDPAWADMNLWYQVQRQTKILTLMKKRGLSSKYLPQVHASGLIIHPGQCNKPSPVERCGHPWCGTPILVTSPFGERISTMIKDGSFGPEEALKCCHDCLSALALASAAGIRHGDICPENVICVSGVGKPYFVLIGWGHAVLEDRDRPSMNLFYSSTYAIQEGKLCAASDAESLIYLLYFSSGGAYPELNSVEGALQWREVSWSKSIIQQKLGDISTVLKAFAIYVDTLCGTSYPMDYEIWLRRLRRTINEDHGKEIEASG